MTVQPKALRAAMTAPNLATDSAKTADVTALAVAAPQNIDAQGAVNEVEGCRPPARAVVDHAPCRGTLPQDMRNHDARDPA